MSEPLFVMTGNQFVNRRKKVPDAPNLSQLYERSKIVLFYLFVNLLTLRTKLMLDNLDW